MASFQRRALLALVLVAATGACNSPQPADPATGTDATAPAGIVAGAKQAVKALADVASPLSPRDQVNRAVAKIAEADSFEIVMFSTMSMSKDQVMRTEMQYVAPDRFHISSPMGSYTVIGKTSYTSMGGNVRATELEEPFDPDLEDAELGELDTVEVLGADNLDGTPTIRYLVSKGGPDPETYTVWINGDGFPMQMQSDEDGATMTARYTRINDRSIRVEPPQ